MLIRKARPDDLPQVLRIYDHARRFMAANGNPRQWGDSYPSAELTEQDILAGRCYVGIGGNGTPCCAFVFIIGNDPTYALIYNGEWVNDLPYGTIHRLASDGSQRGVFAECLAFCLRHISNIRADTHEDNRIMQKLLEKHGFVRCGNIIVANGSCRIAYQLVSG